MPYDIFMQSCHSTLRKYSEYDTALFSWLAVPIDVNL